jgi:hypothetical protein
MDFLQKYFNGGFGLPLTEKRPKCTKKKVKSQELLFIWGWLVPRKLINYTSGALTPGPPGPVGRRFFFFEF